MEALITTNAYIVQHTNSILTKGGGITKVHKTFFFRLNSIKMPKSLVLNGATNKNIVSVAKGVRYLYTVMEITTQ